MATSRNTLERVADYYETQLTAFGTSAQGAGWNGIDAQRTRFCQLEKLFPGGRHFSVIDLGCGHGSLVEFLDERNHDFDYAGCDISARMIDCARRRHAALPNVGFSVASRPAAVADYCVASGIFNVPAGTARAEWEKYIEATIETMHGASRFGFAFNCLTTYSDPEKMLPDLYYGDPGYFFDLCKKKYARNVALLHDYDLYDFTIVVRKEIPV